MALTVFAQLLPKLLLLKERRINKFPIFSLDASLLMRQKSELISQVKLYYLLVTVYCLLVTVYCLLITDYWSLITADLPKWGSYAERPDSYTRPPRMAIVCSCQ